MKEFELRGAWWLPDAPQNRPFGTLKFHPHTGGELELIGTLGSGTDPFESKARYDIVLGLTTSGEPVTLLGCYQFGSDIRPQTMGIIAERYQVRRTFTGHHFATASSIRFKSLSVRFRGLEEWTNTSGFRTRPPVPEAATGQVALGWDYVQPASVRAVVDGADVAVHYATSFSSGRHSRSIAERVGISIDAHEPQPFDVFMRRFVFNLQSFLCLCMGAPTSITALEGEPATDDGSVASPQVQKETVKIAWRVQSPDVGGNLDVSFFEMLLTLPDMEGEFEHCISSWFSKAGELQPVYDLYAGVVHSSGMYVHLQFLSYAQALETYHRRSIGGTYMSDEDCVPLWQALAAAIPPMLDHDFRSSLKNRLRYLNQYSLRKRLEDLFAKFLPIIGVPVREGLRLVPAIVDLRNCLTHYDQEPRRIADDQRIYDLSGFLRLVIETALLTELGLAKEKVSRAVKLDIRYAHMLERLLKHGKVAKHESG